MQPSTEFLTPEECGEVNKALLTSRERFSTRVAIYALRSLKQVAQEHGVPIMQLDSQQVEDWVYRDESLQTGIDREFRQFFAHLVIASLKPLKQIAQESGMAIEALTVSQVIVWFEQQARLNLGKA